MMNIMQHKFNFTILFCGVFLHVLYEQSNTGCLLEELIPKQFPYLFAVLLLQRSFNDEIEDIISRVIYEYKAESFDMIFYFL